MPTIDNHLYESSFQYNHLDGTDYLGTREAELIKLQEVWDFCRMNEEKLLALYIETDRLIIRPFEFDARYDLFEIVTDAQTCADDGGYKPFLKMDEAYNQLMQKFSKDKGRFVIELKQEHKVIGLIHLFPADNRAVWAYEIGYAYEAVSYVMQ